MTGFDADLYRRLVETSPEGVAVVDAQHPERPAVYVNPGFEALTGYSAAELVGRNLRFLQADDREQDGRHRLREALKLGESCRVLLRNYRKDGRVFWNEMTILPLLDPQGRVTHYVGHHRDAGERLHIDLYNTTFGRAAGDSTIRRVAHVVSGCLRRSSDVAARIDGGSLIAFAPGLNVEQALRIGQQMAERVRELRIHHPRSAVLRYISVSVGVCAAVPEPSDSPANLLQKSQQQLQIAKKSGRNQAA